MDIEQKPELIETEVHELLDNDNPDEVAVDDNQPRKIWYFRKNGMIIVKGPKTYNYRFLLRAMGGKFFQAFQSGDVKRYPYWQFNSKHLNQVSTVVKMILNDMIDEDEENNNVFNMVMKESDENILLFGRDTYRFKDRLAKNGGTFDNVNYFWSFDLKYKHKLTKIMELINTGEIEPDCDERGISTSNKFQTVIYKNVPIPRVGMNIHIYIGDEIYYYTITSVNDAKYHRFIDGASVENMDSNYVPDFVKGNIHIVQGRWKLKNLNVSHKIHFDIIN